MNSKTRHTLNHKCEDFDFYFQKVSTTLLQTQTSKCCHFLINMYAASISTIQILKIYGVLKYIANISGLTKFARHSLGSCFFEGCDLY